MTTHHLSHESITRRAEEIWQARGQPNGQDTEIWLEAERELANGSHEARSTFDPFVRNRAVPNHESASNEFAAVDPLEAAAKAKQQKHAASAPQFPTHNAPKSAAPESGKPLWDKPHSS